MEAAAVKATRKAFFALTPIRAHGKFEILQAQ